MYCHKNCINCRKKIEEQFFLWWVGFLVGPRTFLAPTNKHDLVSFDLDLVIFIIPGTAYIFTHYAFYHKKRSFRFWLIKFYRLIVIFIDSILYIFIIQNDQPLLFTIDHNHFSTELHYFFTTSSFSNMGHITKSIGLLSELDGGQIDLLKIHGNVSCISPLWNWLCAKFCSSFSLFLQWISRVILNHQK